MVKERNFGAEKIKNQFKNFVLMSYGHYWPILVSLCKTGYK